MSIEPTLTAEPTSFITPERVALAAGVVVIVGGYAYLRRRNAKKALIEATAAELKATPDEEAKVIETTIDGKKYKMELGDNQELLITELVPVAA